LIVQVAVSAAGIVVARGDELDEQAALDLAVVTAGLAVLGVEVPGGWRRSSGTAATCPSARAARRASRGSG
jgi:hypothetical protein